MKAVFNCIVVKVEEEKKVEQNGLMLPNTLSNEGFEIAEVVSVSPDHEDKLKEGDRVLVYKGCGREFHNPDNPEQVYRIVNISEVPVIL